MKQRGIRQEFRMASNQKSRRMPAPRFAQSQLPTSGLSRRQLTPLLVLLALLAECSHKQREGRCAVCVAQKIAAIDDGVMPSISSADGHDAQPFLLDRF